MSSDTSDDKPTPAKKAPAKGAVKKPQLSDSDSDAPAAKPVGKKPPAKKASSDSDSDAPKKPAPAKGKPAPNKKGSDSSEEDAKPAKKPSPKKDEPPKEEPKAGVKPAKMGQAAEETAAAPAGAASAGKVGKLAAGLAGLQIGGPPPKVGGKKPAPKKSESGSEEEEEKPKKKAPIGAVPMMGGPPVNLAELKGKQKSMGNVVEDEPKAGRSSPKPKKKSSGSDSDPPAKAPVKAAAKKDSGSESDEPAKPPAKGAPAKKGSDSDEDEPAAAPAKGAASRGKPEPAKGKKKNSDSNSDSDAPKAAPKGKGKAMDTDDDSDAPKPKGKAAAKKKSSGSDGSEDEPKKVPAKKGGGKKKKSSSDEGSDDQQTQATAMTAGSDDEGKKEEPKKKRGGNKADLAKEEAGKGKQGTLNRFTSGTFGTSAKPAWFKLDAQNLTIFKDEMSKKNTGGFAVAGSTVWPLVRIPNAFAVAPRGRLKDAIIAAAEGKQQCEDWINALVKCGAELTRILKEGPLQKATEEKVVQYASKWENRYVTLFADRISTFKKDQDVLPDRELMLDSGPVVIQKWEAQIVKKGGGKPYMFSVAAGGDEGTLTYFFNAGDEKERDEWLGALTPNFGSDAKRKLPDSRFEGYLFLKIKRWEKRYVVLSENKLLFYKKKSEEKEVSDLWLLSGGEAKPLDGKKETKGRPFVFQVVENGDADSVPIKLAASGETERLMWLEAIREVSASRPSKSDDKSLIEGYLSKTGGDTLKGKLSVRYFVLNDVGLHYYKKRKDKTPLGSLQLASQSEIGQGEEEDAKFGIPENAFIVTPEPTKRRYCFVASDLNSRRNWMWLAQKVADGECKAASDAIAEVKLELADITKDDYSRGLFKQWARDQGFKGRGTLFYAYVTQYQANISERPDTLPYRACLIYELFFGEQAPYQLDQVADDIKAGIVALFKDKLPRDLTVNGTEFDKALSTYEEGGKNELGKFMKDPLFVNVQLAKFLAPEYQKRAKKAQNLNKSISGMSDLKGKKNTKKHSSDEGSDDDKPVKKGKKKGSDSEEDEKPVKKGKKKGSDSEEDEKPVKKGGKKKGSDSEEDEKPVKKGGKKKGSDSEEDEPIKKGSKSKPGKKPSSGSEEEEKPKPKGKPKKAASSDEEEDAKPAPKKGAAKKGSDSEEEEKPKPAAKKNTKKGSSSEEEQPKKAAAKKAPAKKADSDEDSEDEPKKPAPAAKAEKPEAYLKEKDKNKQVVYRNPHTGEVKNEKPKTGEIWAVKKDKNSGKKYYVNSRTKETTWDIPKSIQTE